jgi:hypothetical protein
MTSRALTTWQNDRAARLDRLEAAHASLDGSGPGARKLTEELNHALVLRLTTEFQGFARDLHDEAASALVAALAPGDPPRQRRLRRPYQYARRIDRGNAGPEALRQDFWLYDLPLWDELRRRYPTRGQHWRDRLALLHDARNGLAHADGPKLARVIATGWPITIRSARRWRSSLDRLTAAMDRVVADHLHREFGVTSW